LVGATTASHPDLKENWHMTARGNPRDPSIPNACQNIERDVEETRTGLRERPTRVFGQFSLPGRNHGTMEPRKAKWQSDLNGGIALARRGFIPTPSSLVPWFTHAPGSTSDPRDFLTADTPSRVTRQTTRTSNYFGYAVSLLESPLRTMNSLETMHKRRLLLWLGSWSLS
jgi:hypothetical protein